MDSRQSNPAFNRLNDFWGLGGGYGLCREVFGYKARQSPFLVIVGGMLYP